MPLAMPRSTLVDGQPAVFGFGEYPMPGVYWVCLVAYFEMDGVVK